ncbi:MULTISPECIES: hypothetical protein [unclassified Micromonospora]|uniref:hypothetical protein n=1 Tax=unclassified Micromonospora TaxID=2617518 RepID=UPI00363C5F2C
MPRQLPPALPGFVGRAAQLAQLDAAYGEPPVAGGCDGPVATSVVLSGTAGAGKPKPENRHISRERAACEGQAT